MTGGDKYLPLGNFVVPIVFLFILLVIGIPGNIIVLVIYGKRYTPSVYRSIIWNLAIIDFGVCAIGIPFNIARIFNYYTFYDRWICKAFTFCILFGVFYSSHLLLLLSVHRLRQICLPFNPQISLRTVQFYIAGCFLIGFVLAIPQFVLIDVEVAMFDNHTSGKNCPITASNPTAYSMAYSIFSIALFCCYTIILFVMYSFIGRTLYKRHRLRIRRQSSGSPLSKVKSDKMTRIAFTISVIFATSYLPLFVLKLAKDWFDENNLSKVEFAFLRLAERLYLVNHVANPWIYAVFDTRFRENLKEIVSFKFNFSRKGSEEKFQDREMSITT